MSSFQNNLILISFCYKGKSRNCLTRWVPISKRLCILRIRARLYISQICAHAPIEDKEFEVKDVFYEQLEQAYRSLPAYDMKLVLGDFNAQVDRNEDSIKMSTNSAKVLYQFHLPVMIKVATSSPTSRKSSVDGNSFSTNF